MTFIIFFILSRAVPWHHDVCMQNFVFPKPRCPIFYLQNFLSADKACNRIDTTTNVTLTITKKVMTYLLDLGPSASQSSDGDASAASRILVVSFLQVCLFWATDLR